MRVLSTVLIPLTEFFLPHRCVGAYHVVDIDEVVRVKKAQGLLRSTHIAQSSTCSHYDNLVAQVEALRGMRHHDDCLSLCLCELFKSFHKILLCSRVKSRGRLIEKKQLRVSKQLNRDACPLFLTSAQLSYICIFVLGQLDHLENLLYALVALLGTYRLVHLHLCGILEHAL